MNPISVPHLSKMTGGESWQTSGGRPGQKDTKPYFSEKGKTTMNYNVTVTPGHGSVRIAGQNRDLSGIH